MMNEQRFAEQIRLALEESTERLPYRVTYRLQSARLAALSRMAEPREVPEEALALPSASGGGTLALGGAPDRDRFPARWGRLAMGMLSALVVAGGLFVISEWAEMDQADEAADIDLAVLTDDVPISAYADRGFGVFIKNTQE
jgi:hypothetical protein